MRKQSSLGIPELKLLISQKLEALESIHSILRSKSCKSFINFCNSISIKLTQFNFLPEALEILLRSTQADSYLLEQGLLKDKYWEGRILSQNCLAFLYYKTSQIKKSLKVLHDSQKIFEGAPSIFNVCADLKFTSNLLIFMCLWKAKKYKESKEFLESAKSLLLKISNSSVPSKISNLSKSNLSGLLTISYATVLFIEKNQKKAIEICENALETLVGDELMIRPLIQQTIKNLKFLEKYSKFEELLSKEYESIVLVSCFIPYISVETPGLKFSPVKEESFRNSSIKSKANTSRRLNSAPQNIQRRKSAFKSWWNDKKFVKATKFQTRRASENVSYKNHQNKKTDFEKGKIKKLYSPSIDSTISTPRLKNFRNKTTELPLQMIKNHFCRPISSK